MVLYIVKVCTTKYVHPISTPPRLAVIIDFMAIIKDAMEIQETEKQRQHTVKEGMYIEPTARRDMQHTA